MLRKGQQGTQTIGPPYLLRAGSNRCQKTRAKKPDELTPSHDVTPWMLRVQCQSLAFCDSLARSNGTNQPETRCLSWVKLGRQLAGN
jgi:hypothetical protein